MDAQYKLFPSYKNPFDIADIWSKNYKSHMTDTQNMRGGNFDTVLKHPLQQSMFHYSSKLQDVTLSDTTNLTSNLSLQNLLLSLLDTENKSDMINNDTSIHSYSKQTKLTSSANKMNVQKDLICIFCKSNKEPPSFYKSHVIKDSSGNVTCPVLFKYECTFCGATGKNAHTNSYCDKNPLKGFSHYKEFNCLKKNNTPHP